MAAADDLPNAPSEPTASPTAPDLNEVGVVDGDMYVRLQRPQVPLVPVRHQQGRWRRELARQLATFPTLSSAWTRSVAALGSSAC